MNWIKLCPLNAHTTYRSPARQITSHCRVRKKNTRKSTRFSRSDYHSREPGQNPWLGFLYPTPIFGPEYLPTATAEYLLTATSDTPEVLTTGRRTFYFDIISYFTLKWDKWNCSLPIRRRPHFPARLLFLAPTCQPCQDSFQSAGLNREYDSREIKMSAFIDCLCLFEMKY